MRHPLAASRGSPTWEAACKLWAWQGSEALPKMHPSPILLPSGSQRLSEARDAQSPPTPTVTLP